MEQFQQMNLQQGNQKKPWARKDNTQARGNRNTNTTQKKSNLAEQGRELAKKHN